MTKYPNIKPIFQKINMITFIKINILEKYIKGKDKENHLEIIVMYKIQVLANKQHNLIINLLKISIQTNTMIL
jgi:hypothetical protein